jgi:hypothetical protein
MTERELKSVTFEGLPIKYIFNVSSGLPEATPEDAGKFLRVDANGKIVLEAIQRAEEIEI